MEEAEAHSPFSEYSDYQNITELIHLFNDTYEYCDLGLNENAIRVSLFILYLIIFVVGLVENLLVIWVNWQTRSRRNLINLYILNMAIADLGVILSLPIWMLEIMLDYTWLWGSFLCHFTHYFYFANMYSSIFFLTCLSVDRYVTLTTSSPFWHRHQHTARRIACCCIWAFAAIVPLPEVAHMELINSFEPLCVFIAPFEKYNDWALALSLLAILIGFLIPFSVIAVFNILTARHIQRCNKPEGRKHCRLIYAYIIVFLICWMPYHLGIFLILLDSASIFINCYLISFVFYFYEIIDCFTLIHCLVNPILYNFLSKNFRGKLISAVVRYIPKDQIGQKGGEDSSNTQHSIVITKDNISPN
ncbi:G-protein coupled receptor 182 [Hemicordylus capensis]|uniref:G-protein coupled receptor 182 n=1 Tax=Hemicordylus capensis TaxID=884348 RepID=UPI00230357EC|nr:G-protein coupled receptor 182 [Hemicordylus capensis]XP_053158537.1 G-protein coupled receptor 182 [Hemicordylus capensis]XP_053158538.1 G-protein coupled receptor 182 [Hemicordylus capensis]XP_053158539.1 G-protein coupled receptor 182 [Hemicordylus capensis]